MIEAAMYFALGFLAASLIALVIVPLVHNRAVRLTTRRVQAAAPISLTQIQADKDQMRAEFAMATRRLELTLAGLQEKYSEQRAELGRQSETITKLRAEAAEKARTIGELQEQQRQLSEELRGRTEELSQKTAALEETERKLKEREEQFSQLGMNLEETSAAADSHRIEIVALRTQIATLRDEGADRERELSRVREDRDRLREELAALKQQIEGAAEHERAENELLRDRLAEVSAEVVRLMAALEGAESPIPAILDQSHRSEEARPGEPAEEPKATRSDAALIPLPRTPSLAERIRSLQSRTSRGSAAG